MGRNMQEILGEESEYIEPTGIVRLIPMFRNAWKSPVFQRNLQNHKERNFVKPIYALYIGIGVIIFIGSIFGFTDNSYLGTHSLYITSVKYPSIIAIIFCLGRIANQLFILTPLRIRGIASSDDFNPLTVTPLTDEEIYIAEALTPILLNYKVIEETMFFIIGLNFGILFDSLFWAEIFGYTARFSWEYYFFGAYTIFVGLINIVFIIVHLAFSASITSLFRPIPLSIFITIFRVFLFCMISFIFASIITISVQSCLYYGDQGKIGNMANLWIFPLQVVILGLFLKMHANEGVMEFSKRRRKQ
jgi:hypothetical protein